MENDVTVIVDLMVTINYAMQQNYVPVIRKITIKNDSVNDIKNLELIIKFNPEFAKEIRFPIKEVKANESLEISPVRINMMTEFLFSLTERMIATVSIELKKDEEILFNACKQLELLAYNEWSGLSVMPEIISAFVTPNHPSISKIISEASELLQKWTNNPSFTAYQTDNLDNVKFQMEAIYTILQKQLIVYNVPPASYEDIGQKIRLSHTVLKEKQGTCLDLTILYLACLESVGLNPILVFTEGHAFAGCWLEDNTFEDCMIDDLAAIKKRIVLNFEKIILVECTNYVAGKSIEFDKAVKHGKDNLMKDVKFECAIDIKRSRGNGIKPIPLRLNKLYNYNEEEEDISIEIDENMPKSLDSRINHNISDKSDNKLTRQEIWERKLLDFSLNNKLLNFKITKKSFQLMTANLSELEDKLYEGKNFRIMERPNDRSFNFVNKEIFKIETERDLISNIASEEIKNLRIRTFLSESDLTKNLKILYHSAKTSMEENGSNTLFLALGFLRWYETDISEIARYAPIVLIPIDIVRNVRNKGYVIRSRQEEVQINITLIQYLKQEHNINITGLDSLPEDEHGIDLPLIFNIMRQAVMGEKRWNVEEISFVGLFSFAQFVMWNDIRNRSKDLEENKVVSSLIEGSMNWNIDKDIISESNIDKELDLRKMAIPVDADSSQLVAIAAASNGNSFVLHGPPGTGKSQTITNIIANALYQGKSVLFVAQKMAALNVVQNRLENIGLAPFCLELHSNKTNKRSVLKALENTLEVTRAKSPSKYKKAGEKLYEVRNKLNYVIEALHCDREYGCSLYQAIEFYEINIEQKGLVDFSRDSVATVDKTKLSEWNDLIRKYEVIIKEIGNYNKHPLKKYQGLKYSIEVRENFKEDLDKINSGFDKVKNSLSELMNWIKIDINKDKETINNIISIADVAMIEASVCKEFIIIKNHLAITETIKEIIKIGEEYNMLQEKILSDFDKGIFNYDAHMAKLKWKQAEDSWFLPRFFKQNKLTKELNFFANNKKHVNSDNIKDVFDLLILLKDKETKIEELPMEISKMFLGLYMGTSTDWNSLEKSLEKCDLIRTHIKKFKSGEKEILIENIQDPISISSINENKTIISDFLNDILCIQNKYNIDLSVEETSSDYIGNVEKTFKTFALKTDELRNIVNYNQISSILKSEGLENILLAYTNDKINHVNLKSAYQANLYYELSLSTILGDDNLSEFHGKQYDDIVEQYRELIEEYQHLTILELVARLSARVPSSGALDSVAATSEMGILKKAIKSNGRMMSLRKLFDKIPTLLRRLTPCMLMSPISVAQYIDASYPKFDIVIFDEASQIPTSEAVGTIARGKNVVVVGDPKQLPPTNFFKANRFDEDNSENEDLESLLDDCLAISMPQEYLKWHYRSRHESLIAYSNMKYYDNKLYTFPSPSDQISEVKMVHLEGYYDKGKTKHNVAEAKAIVDEIIRRLRDEKLRKDSIGVVTFSSIQQNLIDDMLYEQFAKYPELEDIDKMLDEPVFVKNLENVQGDERDVILFSIGYGPNLEGKVSMNFGPLNRDGGWRRLNVAISRARKSMIIYSVLKPEQIDLNKTKSEGVVGLKGFLEFAERGKNILNQKNQCINKKDYLIIEIANSIKDMGYEVECNIGNSEFKMDLGIIDPHNKDTYLLGILLDGENAKKSATARDRFALQPGVLSNLGWKLMRIWTLDWLDDSEKIKNEIKNEIKSALDCAVVVSKTLTVNEPEHKSYKNYAFEEENHVKKHILSKKYVSYNLSIQGNADEFYLASSKKNIRFIVSNIIDMEAPISKKLLMKKISSAWSMSRSGKRVEQIVRSSIVNPIITIDNKREFFWSNKQKPNKYSFYRIDDENKRKIDDICTYEIIVCIKEVLMEQVSMSKKDLILETSKKFGYNRLGNTIKSTINYAIDKGISDNILLDIDNGNIILVDKK